MPGLRVDTPSLLRASYPLEGRGPAPSPDPTGIQGFQQRLWARGSRQLASEFTPDDSDSPARGKG